MKLREVTHHEDFFGSCKFSIGFNRFRLFDRDGEEVSPTLLAQIPNYLDIEVLETVKAGYVNFDVAIGFPVTHIKLDFSDKRLNVGVCSISYGEDEEVFELK